MKLLYTLIITFLCFISIAQKKTIKCIDVISIESTYLNETRDIWIGLPTDYDSTKHYPTLYVLDTEWWFDITYALTKELYQNQEKSPEMIVVGIPQMDRKHRKLNMTFTDSKNNAVGHLDSTLVWSDSQTGGGIDFLNHIEKEIIPYVNTNYSTNGFNTMVGHSLGGYFCAYTIPIQTSFSAFLIYDASIWYNSGDVLQHIEKNLPKGYKMNVYITSGLKSDGPDEMIRNHLTKIDALNVLLQTYPNINLGSNTYSDKRHRSMYMYSIIDGLTHLFEGVEYGSIPLDSNVTLESYRAHYKTASNRLGFEFTAPIEGIRWIAYANLHQKKWQQSIDAYIACYSMYKTDIGVNKEMAYCYAKLGNKKKRKYHDSIVTKLETK
jgi:predicted alpha/beta superfamily hydrolase